MLAEATISGFKNAAIAGVIAAGPVVSNFPHPTSNLFGG